MIMEASSNMLSSLIFLDLTLTTDANAFYFSSLNLSSLVFLVTLLSLVSAVFSNLKAC